MHIYKQILLYILNENTIWPSGAIARDIVSQEKNTICLALVPTYYTQAMIVLAVELFILCLVKWIHFHLV